MSDHLAESIELAARVHRGQVDKGDQPYILHCLYVMYTSIQTIGENGEEWHPDHFPVMCAAVLHDVIEEADPKERPARRREVYCAAGDRAGEAVDALTRGAQESWSNYIDRLKRDWIARLVKIEDLRHNMDLLRLDREPTAEDLQRQRKYQDAEATLVAYGLERGGK